MKGNDQLNAVTAGYSAWHHRCRPAAILLWLCCLLFLLPACGQPEEVTKPAEFGRGGLSFALDLARRHPFRSPYSEAEQGAREMLVEALEEEGLKPRIVPFSSRDDDGRESANIIVEFSGSGFQTVDPLHLEERGQTVEKLLEDAQVDRQFEKRQVLVCANYDVIYSEEEAQKEEVTDFDGLSDNASGVATLLTLARQLKNSPLGYDVQLIFLGAGHDSFRGAEAYVAAMSAADRERTDAVYVVESLLPGDKLYAHAGRNALTEGNKYRNRRKLYEMTGVIFEKDLPTLNEFDIFYNESRAEVEYPEGSGSQVPYREFTLKDGNYVPFDEAGIPVVYIESGNYDFKNPADVKESTRSAYEENSGQVSGTGRDDSESLIELFGEDLFQKRINNVAYVLQGCIERGVFNGLPAEGTASSATDE